MSGKRHIETSDIVLAATLKVKGFMLDRIEKQGSRGVFCFGDVDVSVLEDFDLGKAQVEPIAFHNAIRSLTTSARRSI